MISAHSLESSFQLHPSEGRVWLVAVTMVGLGQDEPNCPACRLSWRKSRGGWRGATVQLKDGTQTLKETILTHMPYHGLFHGLIVSNFQLLFFMLVYRFWTYYFQSDQWCTDQRRAVHPAATQEASSFGTKRWLRENSYAALWIAKRDPSFSFQTSGRSHEVPRLALDCQQANEWVGRCCFLFSAVLVEQL